MNYYSLDISSYNKDQPTNADLKALGLELSHQYGMSFDNDPVSWCDRYLYCRTELSQKEVERKLNDARIVFRDVIVISPKAMTHRRRTVESVFGDSSVLKI